MIILLHNITKSNSGTSQSLFDAHLSEPHFLFHKKCVSRLVAINSPQKPLCAHSMIDFDVQ